MLYLRFFIFNTLLSTFLIFSQKIFDNNLNITGAFLWIIFLVALSFGAAIYAHFSTKLDSILSWLFPLGFLYFLISNAGFLSLNFSWDSSFPNVFLKEFLSLNFFLTLIGIIIFAPFWIILGMIELQIYQKVSGVDEAGRWLFYLIGILGLLLGLITHSYLLPIPSPFWLGVLLLLLFLIYNIVPPSRLGWRISLIIIITFFILTQQNLFLKDPNVNLKQILRSPKDTIEIKVDKWSRNIRLTILKSKVRIFGFYNSMFYWDSALNGRHEHIDAFISTLIPENATIAILGAGGGAQLEPLLINQPKRRIYANDIVNNLFDTLTKLGVMTFSDPRVKPIIKEGRKFIKESGEQFDLIYLPQSGSRAMLNRSLFEPTLLLFTQEAMNIYKEKLKPEGMIAISKRTYFMEDSPFFENYIATLKQAGFQVATYSDIGAKEAKKGKSLALIIATRNPAIFMQANQALINFPSIQPRNIAISKSSNVISDNKPFYASIYYPISHRILFIIMLFCILSLIVIWLFLKHLALNIRLLLPPLFCGINYTLLLLTFQLMLFFLISNPLDSAMTGNLLFLFFLWLGAFVYEKRILLFAIIIACITISFILEINYIFPILTIATICSGGFFPRLLNHKYYRDKISFLLILDGLGAALGGIIYLLIPFIWGIKIFLLSIVLIFLLTLYNIASLFQIKKVDNL